MVLCCFGCRLRSAVQFLLWTELIADISWFLYSTISIMYYIRNIDDPYFEFRYGYYIVWSIFGIITTILGLYAIKKKKLSFLNGFIYYLLYYVIFESCCLAILVISPSLYMKIFHHTNIRRVCFLISYDASRLRYIVLTVAWYIFVIANLIYFTLIVRSYREARKYYENTSDRDELTVDYVRIRLFGSNSNTRLSRTPTMQTQPTNV